MPRSADRDDVSLSAGIGLILFGALLLADQTNALELSFGWLGALLAAITGIVLVVSGVRDAEPAAADAGEETSS